jgi:diguanylate cyclase (GGDEF)-like protein
MMRDLPSTVLPPVAPDDLAALLQLAGEAVIFVDHQWVVRYCNEVYLSNLGMTRDQVIGRTPFDYQPLFERSIFYESIENCRQTRKPFAQIGYSTVLGRWLMVRVFPVDGGMMMLANDASDSVVQQYHLAAQAVADTLTGLPNKLALTRDMAALLDSGDPFYLTLLSLNRFKGVNDALGYAGGDRVLMEVASRLQSGTVEGETLYRLNGDEFAVVSRNDVVQCPARVMAWQVAAEQALLIDGKSFVLAYSAGAVASPRDGDAAELLLKRAALALHQSKRESHRDVAFFHSGLETQSTLRAELEADLRRAIQEQQFVLMLQPQGCLASGEVVGAEALIRWQHPTRGLLMPGQFLPLAQDCGLMGQIDSLVLAQAVALVAAMRRNGIQVRVSINLSVDSLADPSVPERVAQVLQAAQVAPQWLEVEITEDSLMKDIDTSTRVLEALSRMGVCVSIDDFGTGYSSFAYLARFPVSTLKIDRSFIKDMQAGAASHKIVTGMVRLGHSLQLTVVAEGAETAEQIDLLRRLHCNVVQGYGYARPMTPESFEAFVLSRRSGRQASALSI